MQNKYFYPEIYPEIMKLISDNSKITQIEMAKRLNVTERTIRTNMKNLINRKHLKRIGSDKTGHWQILK